MKVTTGIEVAANHTTRGESSCQALLRAADKLFNNPASGDPNALRSYLADKGLPCSLPRWVGNRFNILFQNASILLQIGDTIVDFFSKVQKPQNDLQRAFVKAWSVHQKCHLRSLTLLHKTLTAPWMEEVSKETPILQMNEKFQLAHSTLQMWQQQPQSSLSGKTAFGGQIKKDATWELLHGSCDADKTAMLELYVQLIKGILDVIDRQLASQLPGGEFWEPDAETISAARSCTATNISGERNFAHLDASLHRAPNSSLPKAEGKKKIMFRVNSTRSWLEQKSAEVKRDVVQRAVQEGRKIRKQDQETTDKYRTEIRRRVRDKQKKLSEKEEREREKIEELFEHTLEYGVWETKKTVEDQVHNLSKTRACLLLRKQVSFKTKILGHK